MKHQSNNEQFFVFCITLHLVHGQAEHVVVTAAERAKADQTWFSTLFSESFNLLVFEPTKLL